MGEPAAAGLSHTTLGLPDEGYHSCLEIKYRRRHKRFSYTGNSALTGAYIALLSCEHRRKLTEIASQMTYVDLSSDPHYMDGYTEAMFLPHTDLDQFSSLATLLCNQLEAAPSTVKN